MKQSRKHFLRLGMVACSIFLLLQGCDGLDDESDAEREVIGFAYTDDLNIPYMPFEPELGAAVPAKSRKKLKSADLPYPPFNSHDLKSIGPGGWKNREQIINAGVGSVIFNVVWSQWQPAPNLSLSDPNTFEYDGMVWVLEPTRANQIRWYSERGIKVTAVLYGTPAWARTKNTRRVANVNLIDPKFIAPDDPADFARFTGMIAKRFNGANGNGRIVNFIIQNEVNSLDWYNPGCGADSHPCEVADRINSYADIFNQSYDRIIAEQSEAHVMYSFDHHFGLTYADAPRFTSARRFIEELQPMVGDRQWRMAFHSYPPDLFSPEFGPYDLPKVTFGNIGVLAGYLRQRFPNRPHAWEIHLTENGINSTPPSSNALMRRQLKVATRNVIGTPGIETLVYHRLFDHDAEGEFQPGLHDANEKPRPAWSTWSQNNLFNRRNKKLDDGYEVLPYVQLGRYLNQEIGHWASTRQPPAGYVPEAQYLLLREEAQGTTLLYECLDTAINVTFIHTQVDCAGQQNFGPVGYIYDFNTSNNSRQPLYTVALDGNDYLLTTNPLEGGGVATQLGFVDPDKVLSQTLPVRDPAYFDVSVNRRLLTERHAANETVLNNWTDCSNELGGCSFQEFSVLDGASYAVSCVAANSRREGVSLLLSYGSKVGATSRNINYKRDRGVSYRVALPVANDASWATVVVKRADKPILDECVVLRTGGLELGAASGQEPSGLLQNGGFESSLTDWEKCAGDDAATDFNSNAHSGDRAMQIAGGNCVFQAVAIDSGKNYQLSCHAASSGPSVLSLGFANSSFQQLTEQSITVNSTSYVKSVARLQAPAGSVYGIAMFRSDELGLLDSCSVVEVGSRPESTSRVESVDQR